MANKKVVVAFSGGLDTSYTVMKLTQDGWDVYAACANTGGFSEEQRDSGVLRQITEIYDLRQRAP